MKSIIDLKSLTQLLELTLATAQCGLALSKDKFDIERFRVLQHAVTQFISHNNDLPCELVEN